MNQLESAHQALCDFTNYKSAACTKLSMMHVLSLKYSHSTQHWYDNISHPCDTHLWYVNECEGNDTYTPQLMPFVNIKFR